MSDDIWTTAEHDCQHPGCAGNAVACRLPDTPPSDPPDEWLCGGHAERAGYCPFCGRFSAGTDAFDFRGGMCETCRDQVEADADDEEGLDDDGYGY